MYEFFKHDPESGLLIRDRNDPDKLDVLTLKEAVWNVQGACFSPNGHLYVSENVRMPSNNKFKRVSYFSALNGYKYGEIWNLAEKGNLPFSIPALGKPDGDWPDEMEGLCFYDFYRADGLRCQIHVVVLRNNAVGDDGIFLNHFCAEHPDLV
jgi:hypothetical protein